MNENGDELLELLDGGYSGEVNENENEEAAEETGEGNNQVSEETEQNDEAGADGEVLNTDSDADLGAYDNQIDDIINELIYQREQMDSLQAYIEAKDMTLFEKPLENYTVQEGISLLIFFLLLFVVVFKMIGGIITCKI